MVFCVIIAVEYSRFVRSHQVAHGQRIEQAQVILKAAFGGGGRGMRLITDRSKIPEAFERCKNEALLGFGRGEVFVEQYLTQARHVEVQILADGTDAIHLFERDCSVQQRHQKVAGDRLRGPLELTWCGAARGPLKGMHAR